MKILHTSDWHLGRMLYTRKRHEEFESFLQWLLQFIVQEKIDILVVAGDVFDTTTPGNPAQELYYRFLAQISQTTCGHVVITGGNHDSPAFLEAPGKVLGMLNIHVMGAISEKPEDEVLLLRNKNGEALAIICAVPFLRDRDVRVVDSDETLADKGEKLLKGIAAHYQQVSEIAGDLRKEFPGIPVVGMGHLFTSNAMTTEGDGVRELYVGTLAHVDQETISRGFDYMALGHLHSAQSAGGNEHVRYSGSPIPMGFSEAGQVKKVVVIGFDGLDMTINEHEIPCFQQLTRLSGTVGEVVEELRKLAEAGSSAWIEIELTSHTGEIDVAACFDEVIAGSGLVILRIRSTMRTFHAMMRMNESETLETLDPLVVFTRCLDAHDVPEEEREELLQAYNIIINHIETGESNES